MEYLISKVNYVACVQHTHNTCILDTHIYYSVGYILTRRDYTLLFTDFDQTCSDVKGAYQINTCKAVPINGP